MRKNLEHNTDAHSTAARRCCGAVLLALVALLCENALFGRDSRFATKVNRSRPEASKTRIPQADEAPGDGIMAVQQNGKRIYVNAERENVRVRPTVVRRTSSLIYWSAKERKWKPVPPPSPSAMRAARSAASEVESYVDSRPTVSDSGTQKGEKAENPNYRDLARGRAVSNKEIETAIDKAARRHGVDSNLVRAIVKVESNFNPSAVSRKGAMGLMQLMPGTARDLNVSNPFDPNENIDAGVRYFKNLMNNYGGDVKLSLAAYNAGAGAVARSNGVPHIAETQNYVKQITSMYWNGAPVAATRSFKLEKHSEAPVRMFRNTEGKLILTNEE